MGIVWKYYSDASKAEISQPLGRSATANDNGGNAAQLSPARKPARLLATFFFGVFTGRPAADPARSPVSALSSIAAAATAIPASDRKSRTKNHNNDFAGLHPGLAAIAARCHRRRVDGCLAP